MRELSNDEKFKVEGGASAVLVGTVIGVIVTFVVGVLHGYANPKSCNN